MVAWKTQLEIDLFMIMEKAIKETTIKKRVSQPNAVKRSIRVQIYLTPTEKLLLEGKARQAGITIAEWFRQATKSDKVVPRITTEDARYLRSLAGMANNLNQLVKLAHTAGLGPFGERSERLADQIDEIIKMLFKNDWKNLHQ